MCVSGRVVEKVRVKERRHGAVWLSVCPPPPPEGSSSQADSSMARCLFSSGKSPEARHSCFQIRQMNIQPEYRPMSSSIMQLCCVLVNVTADVKEKWSCGEELFENRHCFSSAATTCDMISDVMCLNQCASER